MSVHESLANIEQVYQGRQNSITNSELRSKTHDASDLRPEKRAKEALSKAKEYENKIQNRVKFLAKEEHKYMKKINETRSKAEKIQTVKSDKINYL